MDMREEERMCCIYGVIERGEQWTDVVKYLPSRWGCCSVLLIIEILSLWWKYCFTEVRFHGGPCMRLKQAFSASRQPPRTRTGLTVAVNRPVIGNGKRICICFWTEFCF